MADTTHEDAATIQEVLKHSPRLRFVLTDAYGMALDGITAVRIDGDKFNKEMGSGPEVKVFLQPRRTSGECLRGLVGWRDHGPTATNRVPRSQISRYRSWECTPTDC